MTGLTTLVLVLEHSRDDPEVPGPELLAGLAKAARQFPGYILRHGAAREGPPPAGPDPASEMLLDRMAQVRGHIEDMSDDERLIMLGALTQALHIAVRGVPASPPPHPAAFLFLPRVTDG